jgi:hypothetical protein
VVDPRHFAPLDVAQSYAKGLQIRQMREQAQDKKRLADLIPQAMGRGGMSEDGALSQEQAINQLYAINPEMAMKLDDRQREQAQKEVADLSSAVRWADTPEKWQQVQQHYGQVGIDLSPYQFEHRERGLMALGQMGEYLKSAPKSEYRSLEPGGSLIDVSGGNPRVVIAPNDGSQQVGAPVQGGVQEGATATNPQTGQKIIFRGGQWVPAGGPTQPASGGFPSGGY